MSGMPFVLVTGMFRSGTTLMARMLDAHPCVSFASDPYRPMFNDLRDRIAIGNGLASPDSLQSPLSSYFCDETERRIMKSVRESNLSVPIPAEDLRRLVPVLIERARLFVPKIAERMHEIGGGTYDEIYSSMMDLVRRTYGKQGARIVGHKEVWCTEFVRPLARSFPDMKFILMVRDPRAVFASNRLQARYPWLFLVRQWRKLAALTWIFSHDADLRESVLVVRYEELIADCESTARRICNFLDVDFSPDMIDGGGFRDGWGNPWRQNSVYSGASSVITNRLAEKWREVLTPEEVRFVETLCSPDMQVFGYEPSCDSTDEIPLSDVLNPPIVPPDELADWIRKYACTDRTSNVVEMMKEVLRKNMLLLEEDASSSLDETVVEGLFMSRSYLNQCLRRRVSSC